MIRTTVFAIALLSATAVIAGEETAMLGVGTENLLYDIEDPAAFFAYRERLEDRRGRALDARSEIAIGRLPARGMLAIALPNVVIRNRQVLKARIQQQREFVGEQERIAREHLERMEATGAALEMMAREIKE